jgi:hypothetical protein
MEDQRVSDGYVVGRSRAEIRGTFRTTRPWTSRRHTLRQLRWYHGSSGGEAAEAHIRTHRRIGKQTGLRCR